ncbi:DedA family protein [Pseudokineococcus lusitanus]|uniref:Membrane protein DedA with SNARE-associated domain n=1 Tax=Pseudokineococcus lusitanus TaxID=763993 RepID=A0A3N1GW87_9ACTN|nr:hypothetical protein [Pseudokineococcus lusitanus]ROP34508.1 membrane protein DedA with SNARE-associated domain [Pseudokineococcus lusitanus]
MDTWHVLLVGLVVLLGSSIPFVPTGQVLSGAAALASGSWSTLLLVYGVCVGASVLGDGALFVGSRVAAHHLPARTQRWLVARRFFPAVRSARAGIAAHAGQAVVTGRLLPGGRAPVVVALASGRHPLSRFLAADVVACALWAGLYVTLGALGGRVAGTPLLGTVLAVSAAVVVGLVLRVVARARSRHGDGEEAGAARAVPGGTAG